jgi:predicted site-specific integrase-resolvase
MNYESNDLVTPQEVATHLGVAVGTLAVWRCLGKIELKWVKIGRSVKYRPSDIKAYVISRLPATVAQSPARGLSLKRAS